MLLHAFAATILMQPTSAPAPTLVLKGGAFEVTLGSKKETVKMVESGPVVPKSFNMKGGTMQVAWDQRGLTVQVGRSARSSRLADFITSPKYFTKEEIEDRVAKIKQRKISREAAQLIGYERLDDDVFMVLRWVDSDKKPWLDALVRVDLQSQKILPEPMTALRGLSFAKRDFEDHLFLSGAQLCIATRYQGAWGIEAFNDVSKSTSFAPVGSGTPTFKLIENNKKMLFVSTTSYGTYVAGQATLPDGSATTFSEAPNPVDFPGDLSTVIRIARPDAVVLRSTWSGLELVLPKDVGVRTAQAGIVVWTPVSAPRAAVLYDHESLRAIARWSATAPARKPN